MSAAVAASRDAYAYPDGMAFRVDTAKHTKRSAELFSAQKDSLPTDLARKIGSRIEQARKQFGLGASKKPTTREIKTAPAVFSIEQYTEKPMATEFADNPRKSRSRAAAGRKGLKKHCRGAQGQFVPCGTAGSRVANPRGKKGTGPYAGRKGYKPAAAVHKARVSGGRKGLKKHCRGPQGQFASCGKAGSRVANPRRKSYDDNARKRTYAKRRRYNNNPVIPMDFADNPRGRPGTGPYAGRKVDPRPTKWRDSYGRKHHLPKPVETRHRAAGARKGLAKHCRGPRGQFASCGKAGARRATTRSRAGRRASTAMVPRGYYDNPTMPAVTYSDNPVFTNIKQYVSATVGVGLGLWGAKLLDRWVATMKPKDGVRHYFGRDAATLINSRPGGIRLATTAVATGSLMWGSYFFGKTRPTVGYFLGGLAVGTGSFLFANVLDWYLIPMVGKVTDASEDTFFNRFFALEQKTTQDAVATAYASGGSRFTETQKADAPPSYPALDAASTTPASGPGQVSRGPASLPKGGNSQVAYEQPTHFWGRSNNNIGAPNAQLVARKSGRVGTCPGCGGYNSCWNWCSDACTDCGCADGGAACVYTIQPGDDVTKLQALASAAGVPWATVLGVNGGKVDTSIGAEVRFPYAMCVKVCQAAGLPVPTDTWRTTPPPSAPFTPPAPPPFPQGGGFGGGGGGGGGGPVVTTGPSSTPMYANPTPVNVPAQQPWGGHTTPGVFPGYAMTRPRLLDGVGDPTPTEVTAPQAESPNVTAPPSAPIAPAQAQISMMPNGAQGSGIMKFTD